MNEYVVLVVDRDDRERVVASYHYDTVRGALFGRIAALEEWRGARVLVSSPIPLV